MCRVSSELYFYMHINTESVLYHTSFTIKHHLLLLDNSEVISNTYLIRYLPVEYIDKLTFCHQMHNVLFESSF